MMREAFNCSTDLPTPPADEILLHTYSKTPPKIFKAVEASATSTASVMGYTDVELRLIIEFRRAIMAGEGVIEAGCLKRFSLSVISVYEADQLRICSWKNSKSSWFVCCKERNGVEIRWHPDATAVSFSPQLKKSRSKLEWSYYWVSRLDFTSFSIFRWLKTQIESMTTKIENKLFL